MDSITRRRLFQRASVGVAAAGALLTAPRLLRSQAQPAAAADGSGRPRSSGRAAPAAVTASVPVVAYIRDATKGEIAIFVGAKETIHQDPELVSRLLQAGA